MDNKIFYVDTFLCPLCDSLKSKLKLFNQEHYNYHMFDNYSYMHIIWGIIYGLVFKDIKTVFLISSLFELIENSYPIVELLRKSGEVQISDTWINIIGYTICVIIGYFITKL